MASPSRLETLDTLRTANWDVAFSTAFGTLFGGALMVGFVRHLHGADIWIGLLGSIPALMGLMQIPGTAIGRGVASFKRYVRKGGLAWRLLYFPIVLLPFAPLPDPIRLGALILLLGVAALSINLVQPVYTEWIGKIVPERSRGWYFSQRTIISTIVGVTVGMIGARLLDIFEGTRHEALGFALIFGLGWICAMVSQFFFERMVDTEREEPVKPSLSSTIDMVKEPLQDRNFRRILTFVAIFAFSQGFAGNFFAAFALESLNLNFTLLQFTTVTAAIGTLATVRIWGFLADRYGNKPMLLLLTIGAMLTPVMWLLCQPNRNVLNTWILGGGHVFNGMVWSGVGIAQTNLYLSTSKPSQRAGYLAAALTVASIFLGLAPLFGSLALSFFRQGMDAEHAYKAVFWMVIAFRFVSILLLIPVKEGGATSFGEAVRQLTRVTPRSFSALRTVRRGVDERRRESAIRSMGESQMSLGISELNDALVDPAPRVRREAATALGRMRSPAASEALIRLATQQPELVEEETLEALGECGQASASATIAAYLEHPSSILRRAAAKALGRLRSPDAIEPLRAVVNEPGDPDLRRAALQALRSLGAHDPDLYADALLDQHPSIRIAAAEAVSELGISDLAPTVRLSLQWYQDEASSELAYALGSIGEPHDLEPILKAADITLGKTKTRRCLQGAAKLFGIEKDFYRLLALDEVTRDTELLRKYRPLTRRSPEFSAALSAYSSGDEPASLNHLAAADPEHFEVWARYRVPESFLVAANLFEKLVSRPGRR